MPMRHPGTWGVLGGLLALALTGAAAGPRTYPEAALTRPAGYRTTADLSSLTAADRTWLDEGQVPGRGTAWGDMATWALVDLHAFTHPNGATPAGPGGPWTYVWPRDASFVAAALSRTGHPRDAIQVLSFLASLPFDARRGFDARYHLDGSRVTQAPRPPQSDGCGWVLWAIGELPYDSSTPQSAAVDDLRDRCTRTLLGLTRGGHALPPPSPDFTELEVSSTTLGTVAPMLAGLRAAAADYAARDDARAGAVAAAATALRTTITRRFGPLYQRFASGGGPDAATSMLLPPFDDAVAPAPVLAAWLAYRAQAQRPAGGLAPTSDWKADGNSWTPETALVAYTAAASGRTADAQAWLTWLERHRSVYGSLPEKVTASGRPAGPAPLLWTSALVLLTLDQLGRR
jgi:hypothetical protein